MTRREIEYAIDEQAKESSLDLGMVRDDLGLLPSQKRFATIVTGVRRCGKSTLLRQWAHGLKVNVVSAKVSSKQGKPMKTGVKAI